MTAKNFSKILLAIFVFICYNKFNLYCNDIKESVFSLSFNFMENIISRNICEKITSLITETVESSGVSLWDVEYIRDGAGMNLRVTIDKEAGISLDDCERVHRAIDPLLDEADPIAGSYTLEVSSPGLDRNLTKPAHFEWAIGKKAKIKLYEKRPEFDGKTIIAEIAAYNNNEVTISHDGENYKFTPDEIAGAKMIN